SSGSRNLSIEIASAETAEAAIELLFDLHRARWRRKGLPGAFLGRARDFHRQWARIAAEKGWLRLSVLKEAGTPVGALYGMRMMQTDFYYQAG
ncbi:GNAT family N-acetyltransferase, partial [Acinetobacter baumannii]